MSDKSYLDRKTIDTISSLTKDSNLLNPAIPDYSIPSKEDRANPNGSIIPRVVKRLRYFRPIIMSFILFYCLFPVAMTGQTAGSISVSVQYSDNLFQLSEDELQRFDLEYPELGFVKTTDDATLATRIELSYPIHYRWWKLTPWVAGNISQNLSNTDKYRRDGSLGIRIDRHYWSLATQYTHSPYIYYRQFTDSDGSGELEKYDYSRNQTRVEATLKPINHLSLKANAQYQEYNYNVYFTEADGTSQTYGLGAAYRFPIFALDAGYSYRQFKNDNRVGSDDASTESNIYRAKITINQMKVNETGKTTWQPHLGVNYEQRYFQGAGDWYGGRADYIYNLSSGFRIRFSPKWNLSLDYMHIFRNVDSENRSVLRLKEFGENRFSAAMQYKF